MKQVIDFILYKDNPMYSYIMNDSRSQKDLYNQSLYEANQIKDKTGKWPSYKKLEKLMKTKTNLDGDINYKKSKA